MEPLLDGAVEGERPLLRAGGCDSCISMCCWIQVAVPELLVREETPPSPSPMPSPATDDEAEAE